MADVRQARVLQLDVAAEAVVPLIEALLRHEDHMGVEGCTRDERIMRELIEQVRRKMQCGT